MAKAKSGFANYRVITRRVERISDAITGEGRPDIFWGRIRGDYESRWLLAQKVGKTCAGISQPIFALTV
jgi:hypothetical protein